MSSKLAWLESVVVAISHDAGDDLRQLMTAEETNTKTLLGTQVKNAAKKKGSKRASIAAKMLYYGEDDDGGKGFSVTKWFKKFELGDTALHLVMRLTLESCSE